MKINTMGIIGDIHRPINISELSTSGLFHNVNKPKSQGYVKIDGNITACVYNSGKIQIYGIKNIDNVTNIWNKVLYLLGAFIDISVADKEPIVKFIVASEKISISLSLNEIAKRYSDENIDYEPEQFPGLIWKTGIGTVLLFSSGNIIITGPNTIKKINETIRYVKNRVETE